MSIHEGHRQRLKDRFLREGLDNFDELYVLELLLYYCIPRKDTNPIAHALLDTFGSLTGVLEATVEELERIPGISHNAATFLNLVHQTGRYYQVKRVQTGDILRTIDQCGNYMVPHFYGRENETVFLLCLDAKCKVLGCKLVGEGSVNSANIPIRRVVETALNTNATTVSPLMKMLRPPCVWQKPWKQLRSHWQTTSLLRITTMYLWCSPVITDPVLEK